MKYEGVHAGILLQARATANAKLTSRRLPEQTHDMDVPRLLGERQRVVTIEILNVNICAVARA